MEGAIDIFSKLVIAVISFIAPLIVYLLSVFSDGLTITRRRSEEEANQIRQLLLSEISANSHSQDYNDLINKSNKQLKKIAAANSRKVNLLNPRRQIYRIFCSLFASLASIMAYMLVKDKDLQIYNHSLAVTLLIFSCLSFVTGILILRQVAWAVVETKQVIADDKSAITIERA